MTLRRSSLLRRTPLNPGTKPLQTRKPLVSRSELRNTKPINPVSRKRRGLAGERRRAVNALREAQHGRCPRCGGAGMVLHGHERIGMAHGASYIHPDVAVCDPCNSAIEDSPQVSAFNGWKISSKHPHDPALHPWEARALDGTIVDFSILTAPDPDVEVSA